MNRDVVDDADDLAELQRQLEQERLHAEQWRRVAEERRLVLEKLRRNRLVDVGLRVRHRLRRYEPAVVSARGTVQNAVETATRWRDHARMVRAQATAGPRRQELEAAVASLPMAPIDPRHVAIVVVTRDGHERLAALLPWLSRLQGQRQVVVVDNASAGPTRSWLQAQDVEVVRLDTHRTYSAANRAGVEATDADVVCLLNDDVEPLDTAWLDRMLAQLEGDVGVVGAQLVYPQRGLLGSRRADLTVQHGGITFRARGPAVPRPQNIGGHEPDPTSPPTEVAAVTGACLLVQRNLWGHLDGLDEDYDFGAEDVDFCWRARQAGYRIVVEPGAVLYHHEGATRLQTSEDRVRLARQDSNWRTFEARHGPAVARAVQHERVDGRLVLSDRPLVVAITVTRDDPAAGYGDWYTADGLRRGMQNLGWHVRLVQRYGDDWYDLDPDVDVVISLLDTYDIRRVARPGLTRVAWVRNWTDRWLSRPWWREYDIALASSGVIAQRIQTRSGMPATLFPLATDPTRFTPTAGDRRGVVVAMNHWGTDDRLAPVLDSLPDVAVYGRGWEDVPGIAERWRGHVSQDTLADVFGRAHLVIDRAGVHTREDGSVNARVFDALAAGAAVVSDQQAGAAELFGDDLPTYDDPDELPRLIADLDDTAVADALGRCRQRVIEQHTWWARAATLQDLLAQRVARDRWLIQTSAPRNAPEGWGDWHYGHDLAAALRRQGHSAWVVPIEDWTAPAAATFDVAIHLRGRHVAPTAPGRTDIIWCISHPDELEPSHLDAVDLVMVASERLADDLRPRTATPVSVLLQATDHHRFRRRPDRSSATSVLFVGNSKFVDRPIVTYAVEAGLPLTVIGRDWEGRLPPDVIRGRQIANQDLPRLYSSAAVVLNDHWEDMRRWGIVSNRVYDALACEATVVSDDLLELHTLFGGVVATYDGRDDLADVVKRLLDDPDGRKERGRRGREAILAAHTFHHRASALLDAVEGLAGGS